MLFYNNRKKKFNLCFFSFIFFVLISMYSTEKFANRIISILTLKCLPVLQRHLIQPLQLGRVQRKYLKILLINQSENFLHLELDLF